MNKRLEPVLTSHVNPAAILVVTLVAAALSACGSGGGSFTPPVSAISFSGPLSAMTKEVTFNASRAGVDTCRNDTVTVCVTASSLSKLSTSHQVKIDPVAKTVKITPALGAASVTFSGIDYTTGTTNFVTAVNTPAPAVQTLKLLLPGAGASALDWASYGVWSTVTAVKPVTGGEFIAAEALSFGVLTPFKDMPTKGSATYNGFMDGFYVNVLNQGFSLSGNADMTAAFNTGVVTGQFNSIVTTPISAGVPVPGVPFGDINFNATISGNSFTGTGASTGLGQALSGSVEGNFFGPAAQEAGGVFRLIGDPINPVQEHAVGAFAVRK